MWQAFLRSAQRQLNSTIRYIHSYKLFTKCCRKALRFKIKAGVVVKTQKNIISTFKSTIKYKYLFFRNLYRGLIESEKKKQNRILFYFI